MSEPALAAGTKAVLIAGPTASGKSQLALGLARRYGGTVINADSMQVYRELRILTARPGLAAEKAAPHRLYGHVPAATRYSVGAWLSDVDRVVAEARAADRLAVVVGGTGLYFKALCEGLAEIPPVPADVRRDVRAQAEGESSEALHKHLAAIDPQDARQIREADRARILRALDVFMATGRSLVEWREQPVAPILDQSGVKRFVLDVERSRLYSRIEARAEAIVADGAMAEVEALMSLNLSDDLPAMKAIGVRQLADFLCGELTLEVALAGIKTETRRYAKRQQTWFRNQMSDWPRLPA